MTMPLLILCICIITLINSVNADQDVSPEYPRLSIAMQASRLTVGIGGFVLNAIVFSVLAPPFIARYFPRIYIALYRCHPCRRRRFSLTPSPMSTSSTSPRTSVKSNLVCTLEPVIMASTPPSQPQRVISNLVHNTSPSFQQKPSETILPTPATPERIETFTTSSSIDNPMMGTPSISISAVPWSGDAYGICQHQDDAMEVKKQQNVMMIRPSIVPIALPSSTSAISPRPRPTQHSKHSISLIHVVSLKGNHISVVPTERNRRQVSAVLLLMLLQSVIDLLLPIEALTVAVFIIVNPAWEGGNNGYRCQFNGFFNHFFSCVSIGNLVAICFERQNTVIKGESLSISSAFKLHLCSWLIAFIINSIPLLAYLAPISDRRWIGEWVIHSGGDNCLTMGKSIYSGITFFVYVVISFNVVFIGYTKVFLHVRKISRETASVFRISRDVQRHQCYESRMAKLMIILSSVFAICWTPAALAILYYLIKDTHVPVAWDCMIFVFGHFSFTANAIVCGYVDPRVRARFKLVVTTIFCCSATRHTSRKAQATSHPAMRTTACSQSRDDSCEPAITPNPLIIHSPIACI